MSDQHAEFSNRLRRLDRKHAQTSRGYTAKMRSDGLIVVEPHKARESRISLRTFILFGFALVLFKGFLMASLGFDSYAFRVEKLAQGSFVEQAGAVIMGRDPVSIMVAQQLVPILR